MASVYKKGKRIYISWYDPFEGKTKNRSTGLEYSKENFQKAKLIAKTLQAEIDKNVMERNRLGIKRNSVASSIEHFLRVNSNKHKSTIYEYNHFFQLFTKKFDVKDPVTIINKTNCEEWLISLREYNYQQNTLYGFTKVLKKYLNFLFEYNYIPMFKLNSDVVYKPEVKDIIVFSEEDISKILNSLDTKNNNFRTMIYLLLYTGLRPSDIYRITVKDIDFKNRTLRYYSEKTRQYFEVPFHRELEIVLKERVAEVGDGYILNYESINNMGKAFRRFLKQIGLHGKGYNLRTFRKTFITLAHQSGIDLATVSKIVGHKKITTTEKYYNRLSLIKQASELEKLRFNNEGD